MKSHRIAIFASGSGSNAETIIDRVKVYPNVEVVCLICDQENAFVLERPFSSPVHRLCLPVSKDKTKTFSERKKDQEKEILKALKKFDAGWVFLAGYMRILGPDFLNIFNQERGSRVLNIHPSLLPDYPGLNSYKRAFEDNAYQSGVTIHFVDEGVDTGPILLQKVFKRSVEDNFEVFEQKGRKIERELYSKVVDLLGQDELENFIKQKGISNEQVDRAYV